MEKLLKIILFLIVPAMALGQVIDIEVRNFKYEVSASEFLIALLVFLFVAYKIVKKDLKLYLPVTAVFFALYLFLSAVSILWASDVSRTVIALRVGIYHILVFVIVLNLIQNRKDIKHLFYSFSLAAVLISAQLVYQVYQLGGFFTKFIPERTSIVTPVGPWVTVSAIIILMIPAVYCLGLLNIKHNKKLAISLFVIAGLAAIASTLTLGKTEFAALVFGAVFLNYKYFTVGEKGLLSRINMANVTKPLAIVFVVLILSGFILAPFAQGFADRFKQTFEDQNTKFRIREYQLTFLAIGDNFFTGVGAGNLKVYFRNNGLCQCYTEASNYLTHFFGELGVIGLLLFTAGGYSIMRVLKTFRNLNLSKSEWLILLGFKTSLVVFLVNGFFEATIAGLNYGIVFWMIVGGLLAFEKIMFTTVIPAKAGIQGKKAYGL